MTLYWTDGVVTLHHGKMQDVLPGLGQFDACVTDPPYGETSLSWDRWPDGWPALVAEHTKSLWTFGSMRMFLRRHGDLESAGWKLAQDVVGEFDLEGAAGETLLEIKSVVDSLGDQSVAEALRGLLSQLAAVVEVDTMVWEKGNGTGLANDRFRRVHELATHWYRGPWKQIHQQVPRVPSGPESHSFTGRVIRKQVRGMEHLGDFTILPYHDDGLRLARSVIRAKNLRGQAIHPTEKPIPILTPLLEYSVPPDGTVLDPFAGSCSTLHAARLLGRHAVGIEADEAMCERAVRERLAVADLFTQTTPNPVAPAAAAPTKD